MAIVTLIFAGLAGLALNIADPIVTGAYGKAAFDAVKRWRPDHGGTHQARRGATAGSRSRRVCHAELAQGRNYRSGLTFNFLCQAGMSP